VFVRCEYWFVFFTVVRIDGSCYLVCPAVFIAVKMLVSATVYM
jgi:hypothetical protein